MKLLKYLLPPLGAALFLALFNAFNPSPRISSTKILQDGGNSLLLPSGRMMEYFEYGASKDQAQHTLVALHGAMTTGKLWKIHDAWGIENKVRIISPSLPGWGLSEAMPIYTATPKEWANEDAIALLQQLGFSEQNQVHLMGASLGSIYAAALVSTPEATSMIKNVMLYVPFSPRTPEHNPLEGSQLKVFSQMHTFPTLARAFEKYVIVPLMRRFMDGDAKRSVLEQWEGLWKCTDDIYGGWEFDWKQIGNNGGRKVIIVSGTKDDIAPPRNQEILNQGITGSVSVSYDGGHEAGIVNPELMQGHLELLLK